MKRKPRLTPRQPKPKTAPGTGGEILDEAAERKRLENVTVRLGKKWRGKKIGEVPLKSLAWIAENWEPWDFWEADTLKSIRKYLRLSIIKKMVEEIEGDRDDYIGRY